MPGIVRINITGNNNGYFGRRMQLSESHASAADAIYRQVFPLAGGSIVENSTREEAIGRYDWKHGIDVLLYANDGSLLGGLQEKFLTYPYSSTLTVEERKDSGKKGAYYHCNANFYFVGYTRKYQDWKTGELLPNPKIAFQDWILVNYSALRLAESNNEFEWTIKHNKKEGRTNPFKYVSFDDIPDSCIVARAAQHSQPA